MNLIEQGSYQSLLPGAMTGRPAFLPDAGFLQRFIKV